MQTRTDTGLLIAQLAFLAVLIAILCLALNRVPTLPPATAELLMEAFVFFWLGSLAVAVASGYFLLRGFRDAGWRKRVIGAGLALVTVSTVVTGTLGIQYRRPDRAARNEWMAAHQLGEIRDAIRDYQKVCGKQPANLKALTPEPGAMYCENSGRVDIFFERNTSSGYRYEYKTSGKADYTLHVDPQVFGVTGELSFYLDQRGFIRIANGRQANATDPLLDIGAMRPHPID
jgi:hypothetical protein